MDKKRKRKKTEMKFEISTFAKLILLKMHWNSSIFLEQQPEYLKNVKNVLSLIVSTYLHKN